MPAPDEVDRPKVILRVVPPVPPEPPPRAFPWRDVALAAVLVVGGLALGQAMVVRSLADAQAHSAPAAALALRPDHAGALARRAEKILETGARSAPALASVRRLARRALAEDPLSGSAYRSLAFAAGLGGDGAAEERLMTIAGDRMKRDIPAGSWLVSDRIRTGRLAEAAERADGLLRAWPVSMRASMGRQLTIVASNQAGAVTVARLLDGEPPWRSEFLISMAKSGDNPGAAMALFTAMSSGRKPPSQVETGALVGRLVRDGLHQQAFLVWAQLLPAEGIRNLADPYDGGFEGLPGGPPFNWQFYDRAGTVAETAAAPDGEGRALYLRFTDAVPPGVLARQLLALPPGRHVLTGRWRGTRLSPSRPLVWSVGCAERGVTMSGAGPPLSGSGGWKTFTVPLDIPEGCAAQWLGLAAPGRGEASGEAWFDDLKITR